MSKKFHIALIIGFIASSVLLSIYIFSQPQLNDLNILALAAPLFSVAISMFMWPNR